MHLLSNSNKPHSGSNLQGEGWDVAPVNGSKLNKIQINQANSVSIVSLLNLYGIKTNSSTKMIVCPFGGRHRDGQDKSPSFSIYPNTNSFWCYGCKTGNTPIDFVMNMDGLNFRAACLKLLQILSGNIDSIKNNYYYIDFDRRLTILMEFSSFVRNKMTYTSSEQHLLIEEICATFDQLNQKYKYMTNEMLLSIVEKLKQKIYEQIP